MHMHVESVAVGEQREEQGYGRMSVGFFDPLGIGGKTEQYPQWYFLMISSKKALNSNFKSRYHISTSL
jgi:hypothetical protein